MRAMGLLVATMLLLFVFYRWFNLEGGWRGYGGYPSPARIWIVLQSIEGALYGLIIAGYLGKVCTTRFRSAGLFAC
jgi:hypothetical protein